MTKMKASLSCISVGFAVNVSVQLEPSKQMSKRPAHCSNLPPLRVFEQLSGDFFKRTTFKKMAVRHVAPVLLTGLI